MGCHGPRCRQPSAPLASDDGVHREPHAARLRPWEPGGLHTPWVVGLGHDVMLFASVRDAVGGRTAVASRPQRTACAGRTQETPCHKPAARRRCLRDRSPGPAAAGTRPVSGAEQPRRGGHDLVMGYVVQVLTDVPAVAERVAELAVAVAAEGLGQWLTDLRACGDRPIEHRVRIGDVEGEPDRRPADRGWASTPISPTSSRNGHTGRGSRTGLRAAPAAGVSVKMP